jgi:hypothetical protein
MKIREKKCKVCKELFFPKYSTMQQTCEKTDCIISFSEAKKKKKTKLELALAKERMKSISQWRRELQQWFNKYIRLRDEGRPCISCGKKLTGKYDAGHYFSVGSYPNLRFHEDNVHGQCVECNQHKHGNLIEYRNGLEARIGKKRIEELMAIRNERLSLPLDQIKEKIQEYKDKIKNLSK